MKTPRILGSLALLPSILALVAPGARAQVAPSDQFSPCVHTVFGTHPIWHQQVRAGISGRLESVALRLQHAGTTTLRIRAGDAANPGAVHVRKVLSVQIPTNDWIRVDVASAGIDLAAGEAFLLEIDGGSGGGGGTLQPHGSRGPGPGQSLYPEPLYANGSPFGNDDYDLAFETFMLPDTFEYGFGVQCPCANDDPNAGCANSTGQGAHLSAVGGSTSVVADDLVLRASQLPAGASAIFFMGDGFTDGGHFGAGQRWVTGAIRRFPIGSANGNGRLTLRGAAARKPLSIVPGSTWRFQVWYRDAAGPCAGTTNLSNAIVVSYRN